MADTNTNPPILSSEYLNALKSETNKRISLLNLDNKTYEIWDGTARKVIDKIIENLNFITGDPGFNEVIPKVKQIYLELQDYANSGGLEGSVIDTLFNRLNTAASSTAFGPIKIGYEENGKNYPVELDGNYKAFVNVPWTDTTYSTATASTAGLIKIGYTQTGKNYPVELSNGKAYVNVPWTDTTYTLGGLMGSTPKGGLLQPIYWDGTQFANTTYKLNIATSDDPGIIKIGYTESGKNYAVALDTNNKAYVNVPWENTTYSTATSSTAGLIKIGYTQTGKNYPVELSSSKAYVNVPWTDTTYNAATDTILGLIKTGYSVNGKNYAVKLDDNGNAYVNVPWTDSNTTYNAATDSALGLIKTGYSGTGKNYAVALDTNNKAYVNVPWTDTTYSAATDSALGLIKTGYSGTGKNYAVVLDTNNKAYVNVPWTDTDTTYSAATSSVLGLIKIGYTQTGKNYPVQLETTTNKAYVNVPWTDTTYSAASQSAAGLMSAADKKKLDGIAAGATNNTVNNEKLTINGDNSTKVEFTANASSPVTKTISGSLYTIDEPDQDNGYTLTLGVKIQFS